MTHPPLILLGLDLEISSSLKLLLVILDDKLSFEKYIHNIVSSIAPKTGLIRILYLTFGNNGAVHKSYYTN